MFQADSRFAELGDGLYTVRLLILHPRDAGSGHPDDWFEVGKIIARVGIKDGGTQGPNMRREYWDLVADVKAEGGTYAQFTPPTGTSGPDSFRAWQIHRDSNYPWGNVPPALGLGDGADVGWTRWAHHASKTTD